MEKIMMLRTVALSDVTLQFYERIAENTGQSVEKVLSDALFRLAGELSMEVISKKELSY